MKRTITHIILLFLTVLACEPTEIELQNTTTSNFEITSTYDALDFIDTPMATQITITPEHQIEGVEYYISYQVTNGEGYFKNPDTQSVFSAGQEYSLGELQFNAEYIGQSAESHQVEITVRDSNDNTETHLLTYNVVDRTDFIFEVTTNAEHVFVSENVSLFINLEALESELEEDITYTFKWSQTNIEGDLFFEEALNLQESRMIIPGNFQAEFSTRAHGSASLTFTIEASNGMSHSKTVTFEVMETDFTVSIIPEETSDYVGDKTIFNFTIATIGAENLSYTMTFSGQDGTFFYRDAEYSTGTQISPISEGFIQMPYRANEITDNTLTITITASNGVSKDIEIDYESLATDFELLISPSPLSQIYIFQVQFRLAIIPPDVDDYTPEYSLYYISEVGPTYLEYSFLNLDNVSEGEISHIGNNTEVVLELNQLGAIDPRTGSITIYVRDSYGITKSKTVDVEWY